MVGWRVAQPCLLTLLLSMAYAFHGLPSLGASASRSRCAFTSLGARATEGEGALPTRWLSRGWAAVPYVVLAGLFSPIQFSPPAEASTLSPYTTSTSTLLSSADAKAIETLNEVLTAVRGLGSDLSSEKTFDALGRVQSIFDLDRVREAVDGAFLSAQIDQASFVEKRKIVDKVLRAVLNDVVVIEDTLRGLPPTKTGPAR